MKNLIQNLRSWAKFIFVRSKFIPDSIYVRIQFRMLKGYWPNFSTPKTLSEKFNWLKLYYHNPLLHQLVDKAEVKKYVSEKIGSEHIIPAIGVWDNVDQIDYDSLPDQFVLKCTHDSGSVCICRDKKAFNFEEAKDKLKECQKRSYYYDKREWAYKGVKPRIIAEPFMPFLGKPESLEYKITVFNGKVGFITVCTGIAHSTYEKRFNDHFTPSWEKIPFYVNYKPSGKTILKPDYMDELVKLTETLAEGLPEVRVDWYVNDGKMYFGEMTFYTWAGYLNIEPKDYDEKLGDMWKLSNEKFV